MKKSIKSMLKKNTYIHFFLYKMYWPIKMIKNQKFFEKSLNISKEKLLENKNNKKIIFVGVPVHNNMGDQAQYYCIMRWLKENYADYKIVEFIDGVIANNYKNAINIIKENINENDIFVFQSGYRTTDVANFGGEYAHQKILKNFKNNVLVFPQTVNFKNKNEIKKSENAYRGHEKFLFLARDEISFETAKKMYGESKVLLYPDIVTSLIGNFEFERKKERDGILFCLRNDEEKLYTDEMYNDLINELKDLTNNIQTTDTNSDKNFAFDRSIAEEELRKKINQFAKFKVIVTDRYHGTIFSLISNTPVIVLNSTDHKLSSGVKWFKGVYDDYVFYADSLDKVPELVKKIYNDKYEYSLNQYFNEKYYKVLNQKFIDIIGDKNV